MNRYREDEVMVSENTPCDPLDLGAPEPWDALTAVQHEVCVTVPGWLLRLTPEDRVKFADWLVWYASHVKQDPEAEAYSVG